MKNFKSKTKSIVLVVSILCVVCVSGILAYFTDTETVENHVTMGIVDIELKEHTKGEDGTIKDWEDVTDITPGETISKIAEINCVEGAVDCYIRAKVDITCDDEELQKNPKMLTRENLNVNDEDWYFCENDGYFYYKKKISASDDAVKLFTEVKVPEDLDNAWSLAKITINVTAEAIQAQNFEPELTGESDAPWKDIQPDDIEECKFPEHVKE